MEHYFQAVMTFMERHPDGAKVEMKAKVGTFD